MDGLGFILNQPVQWMSATAEIDAEIQRGL